MNMNKILIVDDADMNRKLLRVIFEEQYEILEARDGEEAINVIEKNADELLIIFLDLMMPKKNGFDVLKYMNLHGYMKKIPVIMITGDGSTDSEIQAYDLGVSDIVHKPFSKRVVMRRTMNIVQLFQHNLHMEQELEERTRVLIAIQEKQQKNTEFLVNALSAVVEFRSLESSEHVKRVKWYTGILLRYLIEHYPKFGLTDEDCRLIVQASVLHDIGKIAIPDSILLKPGKLTKAEYDMMKMHTVYGCELLDNFKQEDDVFFHYCYDIVRSHHERTDGNGYPDKLEGDAIPIWAQIVGLADVFDALVSKRIYKEPYALNTAAAMILDGECGEFAPELIDCFKMAQAEFFDIVQVSEQLSFAEEGL